MCAFKDVCSGRIVRYVTSDRTTSALAVRGHVGACDDNAMMESFFSSLRRSVLNRQRWRTRAELTSQIANWVERTYHRQRRRPRLGRLTPIEFELVFNTRATAA